MSKKNEPDEHCCENCPSVANFVWENLFYFDDILAQLEGIAILHNAVYDRIKSEYEEIEKIIEKENIRQQAIRNAQSDQALAQQNFVDDPNS